MLNKNLSKLKITIYMLSSILIILAIRNLIVRDYGTHGHGILINNVNQVLMTVIFFLYGIDSHNKKRAYLYFSISVVIGIMALFTIFLP